METETIIDEEARVAAMEDAMRERGEVVEYKVQQDYFAFDNERRFMMPDGVSWIDYQVLNEGQRCKYLNRINRDLTIKAATKDAVMRMAPGDERRALLEEAIVGWNFARSGKPVQFNKQNLSEFLQKASPKIIDLIEKEIRLANPWLLAEMSLEDIDREIEQLQELREKKVEEEQANLGSAPR
jgi:hypothetical protein